MILARVVRQTLVRAARPMPDLDEIRAALARAAALVLPAVPQPPTKPRVKRAPKPSVALARVIPLRPKPAPKEEPSAWDPEPESDVELIAQELQVGPRDEELLQQTIQGCKHLLIEVIRRAAYDWVLYRGHRRMIQRALADSAYRWLFLETEGTADWTERQREGKYITGFEAICESLDLDPNKVRRYIRLLTPKNVTSQGRPAEYRRRSSNSQSDNDVYSLPGGLVPLDDIDSDDGSIP